MRLRVARLRFGNSEAISLSYGMETKHCQRCELDKPLSEWNKDSRRGTQAYCRECTRERDREYYQQSKNRRKEKIRENAKRARHILSLILREAKAKGCLICGESELCCLDFHHIDGGKDFNVADGVQRGLSVERIKKEIGKCCVLCSNCHRKVHAGKLALPDSTRRTV